MTFADRVAEQVKKTHASTIGMVGGRVLEAHAEEADQIGDKLIQKVLAREFTASMEDLSPEERVKYEFTLKNRDENVKKLKDPAE